MTHDDYIKFAHCFGMRPEFEKCTIENTRVTSSNKASLEKIISWPTKGKGLFIFGDTGTGKSHALKIKANILVADKIDSIVKREYYPQFPQWIELTNYLKELMPNGSFDKTRAAQIDSYVNDVENAEWLFIDDFGATTKSDWSIDQVFKLIDARVMNQKQTFISSNLAPRDIENFYGARISSRIFELCSFINMAGEDQRKRL